MCNYDFSCRNNIFLNVKINLCDLCCLSWLFAAGRGTSRHLMSPLWRMVLRWWCGARGEILGQVVEEAARQRVVQPPSSCSTSSVASRILERPSAAGQAAQLAAAGAAMAARRAEV